MKKIKTIAMTALAAVAMMSCSETDYMTFDTANNGVYFTKDTLTYSFSVTPIEVKTYLYKVPFRIMGPTSKEPRTVKFAIDEAKSTAKVGVQYNIGEAVVQPDSINGYIPVEILREGLEGTYATGYTKYVLQLMLVENEYFKPTLDSASQCRTLTFDNAIEQPEWLSAHGDKVWDQSTLGVWHPLKFIKMVEAYGENLEHIPYGDPYVYRTIFKKYIYEPMYDYFNDPANRDMILDAYPDFPFDFPNPY